MLACVVDRHLLHPNPDPTSYRHVGKSKFFFNPYSQHCKLTWSYLLRYWLIVAVISNNLDSILKFFWKSIPKLYVWLKDTDLDPFKWCKSDRIRLQITDVGIIIFFSKKTVYKQNVKDEVLPFDKNLTEFFHKVCIEIRRSFSVLRAWRVVNVNVSGFTSQRFSHFFIYCISFA